MREQAVRAHLGSFGLSGALALQPMYTLSGGQKSRVAFAKVRADTVLWTGLVYAEGRLLKRAAGTQP